MFGKKKTNMEILVTLVYADILSSPPASPPPHVFLPLCGLLMFYLYNTLNLNQLYTRCPEPDSIRKLHLHLQAGKWD